MTHVALPIGPGSPSELAASQACSEQPSHEKAFLGHETISHASSGKSPALRQSMVGPPAFQHQDPSILRGRSTVESSGSYATDTRRSPAATVIRRVMRPCICEIADGHCRSSSTLDVGIYIDFRRNIVSGSLHTGAEDDKRQNMDRPAQVVPFRHGLKSGNPPVCRSSRRRGERMHDIASPNSKTL